MITISVVLLALLLAPLYDLVHMHDRPEDTAGASPERRYLNRGRLHAAQAHARYMLSTWFHYQAMSSSSLAISFAGSQRLLQTWEQF